MDVLKLSDAARANLALVKRRKKYKKHRRRARTRDELIEYLRKNNFTSKSMVERGRKVGDPTFSDYLKEFKQWGIAKEEAFGPSKPLWERRAPDDPAYMVKLVIQFGLWTFAKYLAFRRANPEIAPSTRMIVTRWGRFSVLKETAAAMSIEESIRRYMVLCQRLGRKVSQKEAFLNGVNLTGEVERCGGWSSFKKLIAALEAFDARGK